MATKQKRIDLSTEDGIKKIARECARDFKQARMFDNLDIDHIYLVEKNGNWSKEPIKPENIKPGMVVVVECDITEMCEYKGTRYGREEGPHEIYVQNVGFDKESGTLSIMSDEFFVSTKDIWDHIREAEIEDLRIVSSEEYQHSIEEALMTMMDAQEITLHQRGAMEFDTRQDMQMAYAQQGYEYEGPRMPSLEGDLDIDSFERQ